MRVGVEPSGGNVAQAQGRRAHNAHVEHVRGQDLRDLQALGATLAAVWPIGSDDGILVSFEPLADLLNDDRQPVQSRAPPQNALEELIATWVVDDAYPTDAFAAKPDA